MSADSVEVKIEPLDAGEESENGDQSNPPGDQDGPEFVCIKVEQDLDGSYKNEASDGISPDTTNDCYNTPLTNTDCEIPVCVEINIKEEIGDQLNCEENHLHPNAASIGLDIPGSLEDGYFCQICTKKFANPGNVQRHMLIHTKEKHTCSECTKQFYSSEQLQKHMNRHTPATRTHICEYCQKAFKSTSNLMQHKKVHLEVKPYFCTQCHRSFAFKANLTKHQGKSRCKRPIDEPIQCHVCNKIFDKEFLLKSHLRRHDSGKPFSCDQCTMSFKYKSTLIRHVQLHNGVRPIVCPVCDKAFTHLALLKPHMRVHTGEKPYTCPVCNKDFAHKHNMQRHALRHEKKKHLVCDVCHKKFPKESRLIYHMKTHVNEKYFACSICPKRFSHRQNIIRHYERKHPHAKYEGKETDASVALKVWDTFKSKYNEEPEEILG